MLCRVRDLDLYYEQRGQGRPLVMLHGWSLDHHHMASEMEPLFAERTGWERLYVDLPGCGKTPARAWVQTQDDILQVVLAFVDQVVGRRRFVVAGMSAGAMLARGVCHRRAAQMDGVLLLVPVTVAADADRDRPEASTAAADHGLMASLGPEDAAMLQSAVVQSERVLEALKRDYAPAGKAADEAFLAPIREDPERYGLGSDAAGSSAPFAAPALVLLGRQDAAVGYRDQLCLLDEYPRGTFAVLDRAGHLLAVDQAGLFRALAAEWLDRVKEYAVQRQAQP
jgi:pimeloyl-ACP methyl ester carboxylesterase